MDFVRQLLRDAPAHMTQATPCWSWRSATKRHFFEMAFPTLEAVWLETSAGEDQVLLSTRDALQSWREALTGLPRNTSGTDAGLRPPASGT
jgi:ribosomal protein L3 glutamine methyltransferase